MNSIILPSRSRPEKLQESLSSILETALYPEEVEFLVRLDRDDVRMLPRIHEILPGHDELRFIVGPRYRGYEDMAKFWNELARQARGDWLLTFNDDAKMLKKGWDERLMAYNPEEVCVILPRDNFNNTSFPILPRKIYKIFGRITAYCGVDTWTLCWTGAAEVPNHQEHEISIRHERPDIKGFEEKMDEAFKESQPQNIAACAQWGENLKDWMDLAVEDAATLAEYLAEEKAKKK